MAQVRQKEAISSIKLPSPPPHYVEDAIKMLSDPGRPLLRWVNRRSFTRHVADILGGDDDATQERWAWCEARWGAIRGSLRLEHGVQPGVSDESRKLAREWTEGERPRLATKGEWMYLRKLARHLHGLRRPYETAVEDVKEAAKREDIAEYWAWCVPRPKSENPIHLVEPPLRHPEAPPTRPAHSRLLESRDFYCMDNPCGLAWSVVSILGIMVRKLEASGLLKEEDIPVDDVSPIEYERWRDELDANGGIFDSLHPCERATTPEPREHHDAPERRERHDAPERPRGGP